MRGMAFLSACLALLGLNVVMARFLSPPPSSFLSAGGGGETHQLARALLAQGRELATALLWIRIGDYLDIMDREGKTLNENVEILPYLRFMILLDPSNEHAYHFTANQLWINLKMVNDGEALLREGIGYNPESPRLHHHLGMLLATRRKAYREALGHFEFAFHHSLSYGDRREAIAYLEYCHDRLGDGPAALAEFRSLLARETREHRAPYLHGWALPSPWGTRRYLLFRDGHPEAAGTVTVSKSGGAQISPVMEERWVYRNGALITLRSSYTGDGIPLSHEWPLEGGGQVGRAYFPTFTSSWGWRDLGDGAVKFPFVSGSYLSGGWGSLLMVLSLLGAGPDRLPLDELHMYTPRQEHRVILPLAVEPRPAGGWSGTLGPYRFVLSPTGEPEEIAVGPYRLVRRQTAFSRRCPPGSP